MAALVPQPFFGVQAAFSGDGTISDATTAAKTRRLGEASAMRITLRDTSTGTIADEMISSPAGAYEFTALDAARYFRLEIRDGSRELNGAVLDWVKPQVL